MPPLKMIKWSLQGEVCHVNQELLENWAHAGQASKGFTLIYPEPDPLVPSQTPPTLPPLPTLTHSSATESC